MRRDVIEDIEKMEANYTYEGIILAFYKYCKSEECLLKVIATLWKTVVFWNRDIIMQMMQYDGLTGVC